MALAQAMLNGETIGQASPPSSSCECSYDTTSYDNGTGVIPSFLLVPIVVTKGHLKTEACRHRLPPSAPTAIPLPRADKAKINT